jgi:hypothetical protein
VGPLLASTDAEDAKMTAGVDTLGGDESDDAWEGEAMASLFVHVRVCDDTAELFSQLLEDDVVAAKLMSSTVPKCPKHRCLSSKSTVPSDIVTGEMSSSEDSDILDWSVGSPSSEDSISMA